MPITMALATLSCPILNYNNSITIQMHNSQKENSTKCESADSTTVLYFRRTCEQIEQEINSLLATMSGDKITQLTHRSMEKYILSFKQAVIRSISGRLPNILAAEQKYHTIITQVNDQAENHKKKMKEVYQKYEEGILEIDRLKIQTVSVNQLYEGVREQNQRLQSKVSQLTDGLASRDQEIHSLLQKYKGEKQKFQKQSFELTKYKNAERSESGVQAVDCGFMFIQKQDYEYLHQKILQQKEEKQLYHQELSKNVQQIEDLKCNLRTANQRIEELYSQNQQTAFMAESEQESNKLIKEEIGELLLKIEEKENKIEELELQLTEAAQKSQSLELKINKYSEQIERMNTKLTQRQKQLQQNQLKYEKTLDDKQNLIVQFQVSIENMQEQKKKKEDQICLLKKQTEKITELAKQKATLEDKFNKKFELVSKHAKELSEKNKHLKNQNERLYTAMDQYASNEMRLNKKLLESQNKVKKMDEKMSGYERTKEKTMLALKNMLRELSILKRQYKGGWLDRNLKQLVEQFVANSDRISEKIGKKMCEYAQQWKQQETQLREKVRVLTEDFKQLQEKCLESEINSGKVASSLLEAKRDVTRQLFQKDEIIRSLQNELQRQKQINEGSLKKLGQVVHRFGKYSLHPDSQPNKYYDSNSCASYDTELERQMENQKTRYLGLQKEYQQLLQR